MTRTKAWNSYISFVSKRKFTCGENATNVLKCVCTSDSWVSNLCCPEWSSSSSAGKYRTPEPRTGRCASGWAGRRTAAPPAGGETVQHTTKQRLKRFVEIKSASIILSSVWCLRFVPAGVSPPTAGGNQTRSRYTGNEYLRENVKKTSCSSLSHL